MNTSISHLRSHITHIEQQKCIKIDFNKINCGEVEWLKLAVAVILQLYSAVHGFWSVEELAGRRTGLLGVVKWRGVGAYLLGTWSVAWRGELYLRTRRSG